MTDSTDYEKHVLRMGMQLRNVIERCVLDGVVWTGGMQSADLASVAKKIEDVTMLVEYRYRAAMRAMREETE